MLSTGEIPVRFEDRTLDAYRADTEASRKALTAARRLVAGEVRSLVLIGKTGVGKTHLAAGVANALIDRNDKAAGAQRKAIAAWQAEYAAIPVPEYPSNDPATVAALAAWRVASEAANAAQAERGLLRNDHWDRQPSEKRPSPAWDAWDAEIPALEAKLRELTPADPGRAPLVGPTLEAAEAYRQAVNAYDRHRSEVASNRPATWHAPDPEWANVADLILNMRMEMDRPADDRDETLRAHRLRHHPALVVLDDLGREKSSDWTGEVIYGVVNARYEALLPTLVTSNLTAGELAASPYWPVISRLAEDGELIEVTAPDHRLIRKSA